MTENSGKPFHLPGGKSVSFLIRLIFITQMQENLNIFNLPRKKSLNIWNILLFNITSPMTWTVNIPYYIE